MHLVEEYIACMLHLLDSRRKILDVVVTNQHYLQVEKRLQQGDAKQKMKEYEMKEDGLLMHKNIIYVPSSGELRNLVLNEIHNVPYVGHIDYQKTITAIRIQSFFPKTKKDFVDYISKCMECQRVKVDHRHPTGFLLPLPILEKKWKVITIDFITRFLRTTRQHDSIMVVVYKLTKATHFFSMKTTHTTTNIAEIYMK
jgi:hypothetical protein